MGSLKVDPSPALSHQSFTASKDTDRRAYNSNYKVVEGSRDVVCECVVSRMTLQDGILEG